LPSANKYRYDAKLLTPLLLMALLIAAGILFYALSGHALAAISSPFHFANRVPSCKLMI
jgi:hypothetical protein